MNAKPKDRRTRELARIHIGKKALGLDDDTYRDMLKAIAGVDSARDLDAAGRAAVLEHMAHSGLTPYRKRRGRRFPAYPGRPKNMDAPGTGAYLKKIEAYLAEAQRPWAYANAMARQMFKVDRVEWCNEDRLRRLMLALKYDARRHGRDYKDLGV